MVHPRHNRFRPSPPVTAQPRNDAEGEGYAFLSRRAADLVRNRGGLVSEDDLILHVFGTGNTALWRTLLPRIIDADSGLIRRADGYWAIPGVAPSDETALSFLTEFVAVDVETTGLGPLRNRIIEVALIRYRAGVEVERFESLIQPERRIPAFIAKLTGISNEMVAEAPRFIDVAQQIESFIGDTTLLGHNVGFDIGFLNGEFKRLGRPALINDRIDVMGFAVRVLPELRKPSLDKVALAVGLDPRNVHRAGMDAELAAQAALRLELRARDAGYTTLDHLKGLWSQPERRAKDDIGRGRAVLDRSLLAAIPKKPGVYIMRDAYDRIIYVGKAKNLRDRVSSYYSQPLGYRRKMDGLLESMVQIDVEVTGCELDALILESQLIRRYQPRYNTALRSSEEYPYIRVDVSNAWPRVTLAKAHREDGARYFGPFKSQKAARAAVEIINANFPLRTCPRSFKNARSFGAPCLQLDLGRCLGPCVGRADRDVYMAHVRQVLRFLEGEDDTLYQQIWQGLEAAAQRLDYERARQLRNDLSQLESIVAAQKSLRQATERHNLILVLPSRERNHVELVLVVKGHAWARLRVDRGAPRNETCVRLEQSWERYLVKPPKSIDHNAVDEANILNRWLARNWTHPAVLPLESFVNLDWAPLVALALALSDEQLHADAPPMEDEAAGEGSIAEQRESSATEVVVLAWDAVSGSAILAGSGGSADSTWSEW